jgi:hypothetical protein
MKRFVFTVWSMGLALMTVAAQASVSIDLTNDPGNGPMSNVKTSINGETFTSVAPVTGTLTNGDATAYLSASNVNSNTAFTYNIQNNKATFVTTFDQHRLGGFSQTYGQAYFTFSVDTPSLFTLQSDYIHPSDSSVLWVHSDEIDSTDSVVFASWDKYLSYGIETISGTGVLPVGTYTVILADQFAGGTGPVAASGTATLTVEASAVPEPATITMWSLLGGLGISLGWWRRRKA